MQVKKHSGELVPFDTKSLKRSLSKSGATKIEVEEVFDSLNSILYDGISTRELYQQAFDTLRRFRTSYAARYSLKKAIRDMGPDGRLFEEWIKKIYQQEGYNALSSITVQGSAVTHEIDVVAERNGKLLFCECKFRNDIDAKISVTTPMYFLSRINDVKDHHFKFFEKDLKLTEGLLVTNAYLTSDSKDFANYYGIGLISWDYPENRCVKSLVDESALYPLTCLTILTTEQEKQIMEKGVILVKELVENPSVLEFLKLKPETIQELLDEANELLDIDTLKEHIAG